jgi:hypothetical protein
MGVLNRALRLGDAKCRFLSFKINASEISMPRYYFNIRDGGDFAQDPEGVEFATLDLAREEAVTAVREILSEKLMRGEVVDGQTMEICDEEGHVLDTIIFKDHVRIM